MGRKGIRQMVGYGAVGGAEYVVGWSIISYLSQYNFPAIVPFTLQFVIVGYLVGFLLRKYWVFKA